MLYFERLKSLFINCCDEFGYDVTFTYYDSHYKLKSYYVKIDCNEFVDVFFEVNKLISELCIAEN